MHTNRSTTTVIRHFALAVLLACSTAAWAVVNTTAVVPNADRPAVATATLDFSAGTAEVDEDGNITLAYAGDDRVGGNLTITPPDGDAITIVIPAGVASLILDLDASTPAPPRDTRPARNPYEVAPSLTLNYGMWDADGGRTTTGLGETSAPGAGDERTVLGTDDTYSIDAPGVRFTFPVAQGRLHAEYVSGDGDDSGRATVEPGVINTFIVATGDTGIGTGAFLGPAGGTSWFDQDYDYDAFEFGFSRPIEAWSNDGVATSWYTTVGYEQFEMDFDAMTEATNLPDITHTLRQSVDADTLRGAIGLLFDVPVNNNVSFIFGTGIYVRDTDADFDSFERFDLQGTVAEYRIDNSDDDQTFGAEASAGVRASFGSVQVGVTIDYFSDVASPYAVNANSGDDIFFNNFESGVKYKKSDVVSAGVDLSVQF